MPMLKKSLALLLALSLPVASACTAAPDEDDDGDAAEVDDDTRNEAVATATNELGKKCYCTGAYACGHSRSATFMVPKARAALAAAGVPESTLTQTYGDASASVGTHCPEPGTKHSAATDLAQGSDPCGRVRRMRAQGFAAWFRTAPEFPGNLHIHAVYAGTPGLKASLVKQVSSFLQGRNGLAGNGIDNHCPITEAEKAAVRSAQGAASGGGTAPAPVIPPAPAATNGSCVAGGLYCGGTKVPGDPGTLYRCNPDGTGSVVAACPAGCSINPPGQDDSCR